MILRENQYQIGDVVFGNGTPIRVSSFSPGGYEVVANDTPRERADEISFGRDSLSPQPIVFEMSVIDNFNIAFGPNFRVDGWPSGPELLERLGSEWRASETRQNWNAQKALHYRKNGIQKVIFGRPRKMTVTTGKLGGEFIPVVADFMPVDTLAYSSDLISRFVARDVDLAITRPSSGGKGDSWIEAYVDGPIVNPTIDFGIWKAQFNYTVAAGETIELNSTPWLRRVVSSNGQYLSARLIGDSAYLDEMKIPPSTTTTARLTGTGTSGATRLTVAYREAYLNY